ncbi:NAD(P)-dependent oxidoreductase [Pueribacillus theae]|uniref:NAD(P)-dependent oxidoreductase n=1 Tax=Pueribacillus theae TaxID=2171751 RepID=A0A2U1JRY6_9BACI|nr:SDR family oxidoreductase [Pueribacillus theae]PWA07931.1 NAD(P)-dependent oxidoreductase [Pueribacillus theae]
MKVLVIGANGQIGQQLVDLLQESNVHTVRAMVRKKEQAISLQEKGVEAVVADLEGPVDDIADAARGCDAIVFTAGSGGKTGADKTLLVDLDGAVKTIEAAQKAGVNRYIMVSALQAHRRENWNEKIRHYYVAKHYADKALEGSGLTYTIVRPGGLTNERGTGKIAAAENLERATITREDVAKTVFASLDEENTFNRSFDLIQGEDDIHEALKKI